jgi:hypothetical protein
MPVIPDCRIQNAVYMVAERVSARKLFFRPQNFRVADSLLSRVLT